MTINVELGAVPQFTQGDRLRKARECAGLSQQELADEIGISRRTVSTYEADGVKTRKIVMRQWAFRTGVPLSWIETGIEKAPSPDGEDASSDLVRLEGFEPPTF